MTSLLSWWQSLGDRRKGVRYRIRQAALIDLDDGAMRRECIISDVSETGARLTVPCGNDLPKEFTLLVPRRCRIVRRVDGQVGVAFIEYSETDLVDV